MSADPYGKPPKDIFSEVLGPAGKTVESNKRLADLQQEKRDRQNALKVKLQQKCADAKDVLRDKYEGHLQPILAALESLAPKDGKKFLVKTAFSDGGVDKAAEALDEAGYKGPSLTITVRYDANWSEPKASDDIHPMMKITIGPGSYQPHEEITVTRFDRVVSQWADQGGMGPESHETSTAYGYESLRGKLGEWLGDVAPDRIPDLAAAAQNPQPSGGPALKPPFNKLKIGKLKP